MIPVPWHDFDGDRTEKFVSVMLLREFPDGVRRRTTQGDGGIDVIVPVSDNPAIYEVYQIKKYFEPLKSDQKSKIKKSAERLRAKIDNDDLRVRKWHLTLPVNPSEGDHDWLVGLFAGTDVAVRWKGREFLDGLCAKYRDVVDYYVLGGQERIHELVRTALSLRPADLGDGAAGLSPEGVYRNILPVFERLNSADPHYLYDFAVLSGEPDFTTAPPSAVMSEFVGRDGGPALRIDVRARYAQAVEDRPITTTVSFRVPEGNDAVRESVDRFRLYGEDISVTAEFASVSIDDPLSGKIEKQPMHVNIWTPAIAQGNRIRFIAAEQSGERVATAFFTVRRFSKGVSGQGFSADLESDSGLITLNQRGEPAEGKGPDIYGGGFNLRFAWKGVIAARALDEIRFLRALARPRKLVMAQEFSGPYTDVADLSDIDEPPVGLWLQHYAEALDELQDYADVALRLTAPEDGDPAPVNHALRIASLLRGHILGQRSPMIGLELEGSDLHEIVDHVTEHGAFDMVAEFKSEVANGLITIPNVLYRFVDVEARIGAVAGREQLILSPAGSGADVRVEISLAESDGATG
ncbi:hypothetical protein ACQP04_25325 [Pseudonocardia halophobica]|uniref:hypothetical protein n=1 Tax=Pseudonocardia halophobica TaxID=29401 RepID=UPI003D945134